MKVTPSKSISRQLVLDVTGTTPKTLANFYPGANSKAIHALKQITATSQQQTFYLWGANATGKTHLLKALCNHISLLGQSVFYLPLKNSSHLNPQLLEDLSATFLLCVDDLDVIAGNKIWEEAFFHCYNRLLEQGGNLIVTANTASTALAFELADLKSRMSHATAFKITALNDEEKLLALELNAQQQGIILPRRTSNFLLRHSKRDLETLFNLLHKLSTATLHSRGKITIKLAKEILLNKE